MEGTGAELTPQERGRSTVTATPDNLRATSATLAGVFAVALGTLMYEILLTRIFSVTMWYHFAFVAISVAMFGMAAGALAVFIWPRYFSVEQARYHLALSALAFAVTMVFSFMTHLSIPFVFTRALVGLYGVALNFVVAAIPFICSGICICTALTKFPRDVNRLYAVDLAGAATGCLLVFVVLQVTDGPTGVITAAAVAGVAALLFGIDADAPMLRRMGMVVTASLAMFVVANTVLVHNQRSVLRPIWVKGVLEGRGLYERWNSFSRIRIDGDPEADEIPFGWGLSSTYPQSRRVHQLTLRIDASAGTVLTAFRGPLEEVDHLRYDVTNLAHYLRPRAKVLIIGTGAGRDVLSALVFGQREIVGVEINGAVLRAVNEVYGGFTGHLDRYPQVRFVNDEARSYVARSPETFDVIQMSLIDTWAATTAGAFVMTENSLYTLEAWELFLRRLAPRGLLTVSRWYFRDRADEMYRVTSLASAALARLGVSNPRGHIAIVRNMPVGGGGDGPDGVGTILVSREPLSTQDVETLEGVSRGLGFEPMLTPRASGDRVLQTLTAGPGFRAFAQEFPVNIEPPTDDSPFFFHMLRLRSLASRTAWTESQLRFNSRAVFVLGTLLVVVIGLAGLCIVGPAMVGPGRHALAGSLPLAVFFAGIGLGFMLVEISQVQRLIVFLGHPTYGLTVVLFSLLLASGIGSFLTGGVAGDGLVRGALTRLVGLLAVLVVFGFLGPGVVEAFRGSSTPMRLLVAIAILVPIGLFMGMAFPLGMRLAGGGPVERGAWLWGVNGATSVCGSVIAVVIALGSSISAAFWSGVACYVVAVVAFAWTLARRTPAGPAPD